MHILMLGWELPPRISGGLGKACDGLLRGMASIGGMKTTFTLPRSSFATGSYPESVTVARPTGASSCRISSITQDLLKSPASVHGVHPATGGVISRLPSSNRRVLAPTGTYSPGLESEAAAYTTDLMDMLPSLEPFDIIHAHDWLTYEAGIKVKAVTGKKLIVHAHSTEFDRAEASKRNVFIKSIEQRGMESADRIIAVSDYTKEIIVQMFGQHPDRIETIHNAGEFRSGANSKGNVVMTSDGDKVVTFLGRITYQKGPEQFIEAAYHVWRAMPNTKFVMAGDGDLLPLVKSLARSLGMSSVISFPGFLDHEGVQELLSRSAVFIMPSMSEPFGLAALEAIEAGVPVILSSRCGLTETISSVVKVDPEDIDAIAEACIGLLRNPESAWRLAAAARPEASCHTWTRAAAQLHELYGRLLHSELAGALGTAAV